MDRQLRSLLDDFTEAANSIERTLADCAFAARHDLAVPPLHLVESMATAKERLDRAFVHAVIRVMTMRPDPAADAIAAGLSPDVLVE